MQQEERSPGGQDAYVVWEVNSRGKRGRKSGLLSWGEAQILKASLSTITGRSRCTYEVEVVKRLGGEQHGPVD